MKRVHVVSSKVIDDREIVYKGNQLSPMFVYNETKGVANIVLFRGPMSLNSNDLVDAEDKVNNDSIHSRDAINIIAELPFVDLVGGVALQRIMIRKIVDVLQSMVSNVYWLIDGDDIKFCKAPVSQPDYKKLSVSIATKTATSVLIHIGLNIFAGQNAPAFAGSLIDIVNVLEKDEKVYEFMRNIADAITIELNDIYEASMKVYPK